MADVEKQIDAVVVAAALEMVETGLRSLADEVAKVRGMLGAPQPEEPQHVCPLPINPPPFTIFRCPCGKHWRFYPGRSSGSEVRPAGWEEVEYR